MTQEIESVKPALTVILDDGDFIINSTGAIGKLMAQSVLALTASAKRVTVISDGEMRVMKRNGNGAGLAGVEAANQLGAARQIAAARRTPVDLAATLAAPDDIQDSFVSDLEAGRTGEQAMGEKPVPTPGPSDPVAIPAKKRKPVIYPGCCRATGAGAG